MIKATYHRDESTKEEVIIIAWDRDKRYQFVGSNGVVESDKTGYFDLKRTNKLYNLPEWDDEPHKTNKEVSEEIKKCREKSCKYSLRLVSGIKEFKSLSKALNYLKSVEEDFDFSVIYSCKTYSMFLSLIEREGSDLGFYEISKDAPVKQKTISNWVYKQI